MRSAQIGSGQFSVIGLGGYELEDDPDWPGAHDVLTTASEAGIDWIDTAESYFDKAKERAIAAAQPKRNIYAVQPSLRGGSNKPRVVKRPADAAIWKMEAVLPKRFDLDNDIIVIRTYGGYSAEARPIFSQPVLTEAPAKKTLPNPPPASITLSICWIGSIVIESNDRRERSSAA